MLYVLTQHSQRNRPNHPFLLYKCNPRKGVVDDNHVCVSIIDDEYSQLWSHSERKWQYRKIKNVLYTETQHKNYCDVNNCGVTHFGIHPELLPLSSICFDMMHMKAAVIRRMMGYLRNFILKQSSSTIQSFSTQVLRRFWGVFHTYCWNNKFNFSKFNGNELNLFVENSPIIIKFLDDTFIPIEEIQQLKSALGLLPSIFKFISMTTYIEGGEEYTKLWFSLN
jgi:hypothetical protein